MSCNRCAQQATAAMAAAGVPASQAQAAWADDGQKSGQRPVPGQRPVSGRCDRCGAFVAKGRCRNPKCALQRLLDAPALEPGNLSLEDVGAIARARAALERPDANTAGAIEHLLQCPALSADRLGPESAGAVEAAGAWVEATRTGHMAQVVCDLKRIVKAAHGPARLKAAGGLQEKIAGGRLLVDAEKLRRVDRLVQQVCDDLSGIRGNPAELRRAANTLIADELKQPLVLPETATIYDDVNSVEELIRERYRPDFGLATDPRLVTVSIGKSSGFRSRRWRRGSITVSPASSHAPIEPGIRLLDEDIVTEFGSAGAGAELPRQIDLKAKTYDVTWAVGDRECSFDDMCDDGYDRFRDHWRGEGLRNGVIHADGICVELHPDGRTVATVTFVFVFDPRDQSRIGGDF
jgi:hypothetical protein